MKITRVADEKITVEFDFPDERDYLSRAVSKPLTVGEQAVDRDELVGELKKFVLEVGVSGVAGRIINACYAPLRWPTTVSLEHGCWPFLHDTDNGTVVIHHDRWYIFYDQGSCRGGFDRLSKAFAALGEADFCGSVSTNRDDFGKAEAVILTGEQFVQVCGDALADNGQWS